MGKTFRGHSGPLIKQDLVVDTNSFENNVKHLNMMDNLCISVTRATSTDSRYYMELNRNCIKSGSPVGTLIFDPKKRNHVDINTQHLDEDPYDYMAPDVTTKPIKDILNAENPLLASKLFVNNAMMNMDDEFAYMDDYSLMNDALEEANNALTEEEENEDLLLALFKRCNRMKKFFNLPDEQRVPEATITLETNISRKFYIHAKSELIFPKLLFSDTKKRDSTNQSESIHIGIVELGSSQEFYIRIKNPGTRPIRVWRILIGDHTMSDMLSQCGSRTIERSKIRNLWDMLLYNTTEKQPKHRKTAEREYTLAKKRMGIGALIPANGEWILGPIVFTPRSIQRVDAVIYVMNNLTYCDWVTVTGVGAGGKLAFNSPSDITNPSSKVENGNQSAKNRSEHTKFTGFFWTITEEQIGAWENGTFIPSIRDDQPLRFTTEFSISNAGNLKIILWDININRKGCEAYGLRLHSCRPNTGRIFEPIATIEPGQNWTLNMAFTPDFTSSQMNVTLYLSLQSVINQKSQLSNRIEYMALPIVISLPRKILPFLYDYQRNAISLSQVHNSYSLIMLLWTCIVWIIRWMLVLAAFSTTIYIVNITFRELKTLRPKEWEINKSILPSSQNEDSPIETVKELICEKAPVTVGGEESMEEQKLREENNEECARFKPMNDIDGMPSETGPVGSPHETSTGETSYISVEITSDEKLEEKAHGSEAAKSQNVSEDYSNYARIRASSDTAAYKSQTKSRKHQHDKKNRSNYSNTSHTKLNRASDSSKQNLHYSNPAPRESHPKEGNFKETHPRESHQQFSIAPTSKRKNSRTGDNNSILTKTETTGTASKFPEKILLRASDSKEAKPIIKKLRPLPAHLKMESNDTKSHILTSTMRQAVIAPVQQPLSSERETSNLTRIDSGSQYFPVERTSAPSNLIENQQTFKFGNNVNSRDSNDIYWNAHRGIAYSPPRRTRSVSPTMYQDQPLSLSSSSFLSHHQQSQQQEQFLFQRLTQAFHPTQESSGYFSLFSGSSNPDSGEHTFNPMVGRDFVPTDESRMYRQNTFNPLNYGFRPFGGDIAREPNNFFSINNPNRNNKQESSTSLFSGDSSSLFSSLSSFSFMHPTRRFNEELDQSKPTK
jgi:hypothetical protein